MVNYSITIWKSGPKDNGKVYTKKQVNNIIRRILEKETPYSFEIFRLETNGWKTMVYKHHTKNEFWLKKLD